MGFRRGILGIVGYKNLYRHQKYDPVKRVKVPELGWPRNDKTRTTMLNDLRAAIEDGHMIVNDRELVSECLTFEDNGSEKYQAREACYDDTVFAWGVALQVRQRAPRQEAIIPAGYNSARTVRRAGRSRFR